MTKMILTTVLAASMALSTAALAHRATPSAAPAPVSSDTAKPDYAKTFFEQLERNAR